MRVSALREPHRERRDRHIVRNRWWRSHRCKVWKGWMKLLLLLLLLVVVVVVLAVVLLLLLVLLLVVRRHRRRTNQPYIAAEVVADNVQRTFILYTLVRFQTRFLVTLLPRTRVALQAPLP